MLALFLLAIQCHGLVEDSRFKVTKCSNEVGQPELTFTIDKEYFEQNLSWQADQEGFEVFIGLNRWGDLNFKLQKFMLVGNVYQKTVPENQLEVNLENECEFFYTIVPKSLFQIEDFEF